MCMCVGCQDKDWDEETAQNRRLDTEGIRPLPGGDQIIKGAGNCQGASLPWLLGRVPCRCVVYSEAHG